MISYNAQKLCLRLTSFFTDDKPSFGDNDSKGGGAAPDESIVLRNKDTHTSFSHSSGVDVISKKELKLNEEMIASDKEYVLKKVRHYSPYGLTSHELAEMSNDHRQRFAPRLTDLFKEGLLTKVPRACGCSKCSRLRTEEGTTRIINSYITL